MSTISEIEQPGTPGVPDFKITLLKGPQNYSLWKREFKILARCHGVHSFYSEFTAPKQPERPTPPKSDDFKANPSDNPKKIQSKQAAFRKIMNEYEIKLQGYKLDLEEYRLTTDRARKACLLLAKHIDPSIRNAIEWNDDPSEAAAAVRALCHPSRHQALDMAYTALEELELANCKTMTTYLALADSYRQDIREVTGDQTSYDDQQMISKLLRGLPNTAVYNEFKRYLAQDSEDGTVRNLTLKGVHIRLLAEEAKEISERKREWAASGFFNKILGW